MKAVVLTGHGDLDRLQYIDYPLPEIADDEVVVVSLKPRTWRMVWVE